MQIPIRGIGIWCGSDFLFSQQGLFEYNKLLSLHWSLMTKYNAIVLEPMDLSPSFMNQTTYKQVGSGKKMVVPVYFQGHF